MHNAKSITTGSAIASVRRPRTLISILTFVSCVRGLLSLCSLIILGTTTLRGVTRSLHISQHRNGCLWIDLHVPRSKVEWFIYPSLLKVWSIMSLIKYMYLDAWNKTISNSPLSLIISFCVWRFYYPLISSVGVPNVKYIRYLTKFLCCLRSIATHRDHFVRRLSVRLSVCLSVCPSVTLTELCFAGNTCIPRNAATIFNRDG